VTFFRSKQEKPSAGHAGSTTGVRIIAAFKLFKGAVLFAAGVGALKLLHQDLALLVEHWINVFRVDPNDHFILSLLEKFSILDSHKLKQLSAGTFFYAAVLFTEGTGLFLGKRWAEYFTIFATGSFIPFEIYELTRRVTWPRGLVLLINIVVVIYLVIEVYRNRKNR
jgi:uncharacterized membrane protein (DUF2068 family)